MLADFGLVGRPLSAVESSAPGGAAIKTILIIPRYSRPYLGIRDYSVRLRDALARSPDFEVILLEDADPVGVKAEFSLGRPDAAILVDIPNPDSELAGIPFYTCAVLLNEAPAIWLVGFSANQSNLEDVVRRILVERPGARIRIAMPDMWDPVFEARVHGLRQLHGATEAQISLETLPHAGYQVIELLGADCLVVFAYDPRHAEELEAYSALALATERPVFFARHAAFPDCGGSASFIEDVSIDEAINFGIAAQIGVLHDFGEWQMSMRLGTAIKSHLEIPKPAPLTSPPLPIPAGSPSSPIENLAQTVSDNSGPQVIGLEELLALYGRSFVDAAYREIAGRLPTPDELKHLLRRLSQGDSKADIVVELYMSMGKQPPPMPGLGRPIRRNSILELPLLGPLLEKLGWEARSPRYRGCANPRFAPPPAG
jgi:hypothetical protein